MNNTDLDFRVKDLSAKIKNLESEIEQLKAHSTDDDIWDNSDLMRKWNISKRTLATWRANGLIDYVQVGGKIWYTKENRNSFLLRNSIKT